MSQEGSASEAPIFGSDGAVSDDGESVGICADSDSLQEISDRIICAGDDSDRISCVGEECIDSNAVQSPSTPLLDAAGALEEDTCIIQKGEAASFRQGARGWQPGLNCRGWMDKDHPLVPQARVLVVNVVVSCGRLPAAVLKSVAIALRGSWAKVRSSGTGAVLACAAWFMGMPTARVKQIYKTATADPCLWSPELDADRFEGETATERAVESTAEKCQRQLRDLVRLALANAFEGRSYAAYERDAVRLSLAYADVNVWWRDRKFAKEVASLGVMVMQQLDAHDFNEILPGLGIPSDFAVVSDSVSLGDSVMSRHDVVLVLCLALISARTGRVYNPMHSGDPMPVGAHGGEAMARMWVRAFARHPASWGMPVLCSWAAAVGGDGGLCAGGVDHRHQSSSAAEIFWRLLFPSPEAPLCTTWDPFHRVDNAVWRAVRRVELVLQVFDISKELDYLFGMSEGVAIFRGVAELLGDKGVRKIRAPGGTRKVVYLAGVPGHLIVNFFALYNALWARLAWKQAGHSAQKLRHILDLAARFSAVTNVAVMLLLQDLLARIVQPLARQVQEHIEPVALSEARRVALAKITMAGAKIRRLRVLVRVMSLLRQHLVVQDLQHLLQAFAVGSMRSLFPSFFAHAGEIIGPRRCFQGVALKVPDAHDPSQEHFLGAHCQCPAKVAAAEKAFLEPASQPLRGRRGRAPAAAAPPRKLKFIVNEQMDWVSTPPRCQVTPAVRRLPAGLRSEGMFRHAISDFVASPPWSPCSRLPQHATRSEDLACVPVPVVFRLSGFASSLPDGLRTGRWACGDRCISGCVERRIIRYLRHGGRE